MNGNHNYKWNYIGEEQKERVAGKKRKSTLLKRTTNQRVEKK